MPKKDAKAPARLPCKFYAQGHCAFGKACVYAHVGKPKVEQAPADDQPVCQFFLSGNCTFGDSCRNRHPAEPAAEKKEPDADRPLCRFFLSGTCTFGDACRNRHTVEPAAQPTVEITAVSSQKSPPPDYPPPPPPPAAPRWGKLEIEDAECGICFESIKSRKQRFGMLESCDHTFCLSCIRAWRKQREQQDRNNLRLCPQCRNESFFVIPSDTLILDPKEKGKIVDQYKLEMARIPCKLFDYGRGKCPFGTSCFYAHLNPDGTRWTPAPLRWMAGSDGKQVYSEVKLSDFLD